ncbi:7073_t:CDS:2 [Funneliformis caledonium]|uniref:NADH dehydrogenase [ubiquinone] 1 beta subcomplex subunit 9 n=1 Tax=Funneliformis caledonium TaxID=1117310 RepID=A0A9N9GR75_9GLOM|nr:7073_t:CDS:2 [Funneliformis caledonium]
MYGLIDDSSHDFIKQFVLVLNTSAFILICNDDDDILAAFAFLSNIVNIQIASFFTMLQPAFPVVHKQYVTSLYRRSLRTALDWYVDRSAWRPVALEIRARFEANRNVASLQELRKILLDTEKELENYSHPDPYKCN